MNHFAKALRQSVPIAILTLGALALALLPFAAGGQVAPTSRDTSHVTTQRIALDSMRLVVKPQLERYCASSKPLSYVKAACPIFTRNLARLVAAESALVAPLFTPPPVVAVATVTVSLADNTLTVGQTTPATARTYDANGAQLTGRAISWSSLSPSVATVSGVGIVSGLSAGTASIRATSETIVGAATVTVSNVVIPAGTTDTTPTTGVVNGVELPRVYLVTTVASTPSAGRTLTVASGGNLQAAIDSACSGDRIVAAAGATYSGNYTVGVKSCGIAGGWITVTTSGSCPAEGTRVSPTTAATFPKLVSPSINATLTTSGAAARWRFTCVEITHASGVTANTMGIVALNGGEETSLADLSSDIIFDRVYIHGHSALDTRRCLAFNGKRSSVVDSYLSECHSAFDAQAVAMWNGPGPYKIVNNYLEASGENIATGGAHVSIANLVPSDIEIRRNYFYKPLAWKGTWLLKNLLEFKAASRVLIEANVMENSPPDGQAGFAFVLWSVNQDGTCTWCVTADLTIRHNVIRNVGAVFQLAGKYWGAPSPLMARLAITGNVALGVGAPAGTQGRVFQIADGAIANLTVNHNTFFSAVGNTIIFGPDVNPAFTFTNNLGGGGPYMLYSTDGVGSLAWTGRTGAGSAILGNVLVGDVGSLYPPGNLYPTTFSAVGLVGGAAAATSAAAALTDLALASSSAYKGRATDGTDPGANIATVLAATAGVKP